jgi:Ca-activated chloride channel family protein
LNKIGQSMNHSFFFKLYVRGLLLMVLFFCTIESYSQLKTPEYKPPTTRILFVFDASNSMAGFWESDIKINIARRILISMIDSLQQIDNVQMALRVYGHQSPVPPQDCNDTRLEVPFDKHNASIIRQRLRFINPKGTTPIANSLAESANDFPPCSDCRNVVILISDGIEACDGDPCLVSDELQKKGIILKPFIIGIGIDENFAKTFECVGHYYNATHEESFKEMLNIVITQALNSTTAQVNLLDENGLPTESNVNMTFYDRYSGKLMHNYVHTINNRGNPDTLILDPLLTYRMVVNTLPPVTVDSIRVTTGKHTIVAADVPQGSLVLTSPGLGNMYRDLSFFVRKSGDYKTLNMQKIGEQVKYLKGKYDVEIPVLPRVLINDVEIKQSTTTTIEVARPGLLTLILPTSGYGSIYVQRATGLEWIFNMSTSLKTESVVLQPGNYVVVFRTQNAKQSIYTVTRKVEIKSGSSIALELN